MFKEKKEEHKHSHEMHVREEHREHEAHRTSEAHGGGGKPFSKKVSENYGVFSGIALILIALIVAYLVISAGGAGTPSGSGSSTTPLAPLALSVTRIRAPDCSDCFDVDVILQQLSSKGVVLSVRVLDYSDNEAKALVSKYNIKKLPTLLFSGYDEKRQGEVSTLVSSFASQAPDGTFVLLTQKPPFYDVAKNKVVGRVDFVSLVALNCTQCFNISLLVSQLGAKPPVGFGVTVSSERIVDYASEEGKRLIVAYNISSIPSLIASSELSEYPEVTALWPRVGSVEADGSFVIRATTPPFVNLSNGAVEGLVELIYLNDSSCKSCYDVKLHKQVLEQMGVFILNETVVEVNSTFGMNLTKAYNITLVPTVLLSPEAGVYGSLKQVWTQVGTVEKDGWFVFRNMDAIRGAVYKNLETSEVVGLPTTSPNANSSGV